MVLLNTANERQRTTKDLELELRLGLSGSLYFAVFSKSFAMFQSLTAFSRTPPRVLSASSLNYQTSFHSQLLNHKWSIYLLQEITSIEAIWSFGPHPKILYYSNNAFLAINIFSSIESKEAPCTLYSTINPKFWKSFQNNNSSNERRIGKLMMIVNTKITDKLAKMGCTDHPSREFQCSMELNAFK